MFARRATPTLARGFAKVAAPSGPVPLPVGELFAKLGTKFLPNHYNEWASVIKDYNPIHDCSKIDVATQKSSTVIVPGKLSLCCVTEMLTKVYPGFRYVNLGMKFKAPIYFLDDVRKACGTGRWCSAWRPRRSRE